MYNLNVNLAQSAANAVNNLLTVDNACTTPRTPEILNSLIAMTNPLDNYTFGDDAPKASAGPPTSLSNDSNSSSCSQLESPTNTPPSVQHTCSQLIKAGLKLSIEQKRKHNSESEDLLDLDHCKRIKKSESESDERKTDGNNEYDYVWGENSKLTAEDEERRRRRRERNKIAATKCRLKKREKTINLIQESQTLDDQNVELKKQVQELQNQRRQLVEILAAHRPICKNSVPRPTRDAVVNRLPPFLLSNSVIESNHSYSRPSSVDPSYKAQTIDMYNRPASVGGVTSDTSYSRSIIQYNKPPNIIVEAPVDSYQPHFTNLDNTECITYHYNNQQCHNYNGNNQNYSSTGMDNGCMA